MALGQWRPLVQWKEPELTAVSPLLSRVGKESRLMSLPLGCSDHSPGQVRLAGDTEVSLKWS